MYYFVSKPSIRLDYDWKVSYYKVDSENNADAIRIYPDGSIKISHIKDINRFFLRANCRLITKEEYESVLEI